MKWWGWIVVAAGLVSVAHAQQGRAPDPHWGAENYPRRDYEWRGNLSLNRFTVYSSTSFDPNNPDTGRYNNDVRRSGGFNLFNVQHTAEIDFSPRRKWTYTWNLGVGYAGEEPTETLQNDYVHRLRGLRDVPVAQSESGFMWSAGGAVNYWFGDYSHVLDRAELDDSSTRFSGVVGFGGVASTLFYEPEIHIGLEADIPDWNIRIRGLHRVSVPIGGEIYRDVADLSQVTQGSIYYVPSNYYTNPRLADLWDWRNLVPDRWFSGLHTLLGRPEVGLHVTHDTGLFEDVQNDGISTWFVSASVEWSSGVRVELWNDMLNGTDRGPTFGLLLGVDLMTFYDKSGDR